MKKEYYEMVDSDDRADSHRDLAATHREPAARARTKIAHICRKIQFPQIDENITKM